MNRVTPEEQAAARDELLALGVAIRRPVTRELWERATENRFRVAKAREARRARKRIGDQR